MNVEAGASIPTIIDVMDAVTRRVANLAFNPPEDEVDEVTGAIAEAYGSAFGKNADLSTLIIYGRACHALADSYRARGNADNASLYHAIGQDMLARALEAVENLTVQTLDIVGGRQ